MIPDQLQSGTVQIVQNVALPSKKAPLPIIGHLMANYVVYSAVLPDAGNSSQFQRKKNFTRGFSFRA